jgi:hypothetical protein
LAYIREIKCRNMRWLGEIRNLCSVGKKRERKRPHRKLGIGFHNNNLMNLGWMKMGSGSELL